MTAALLLGLLIGLVCGAGVVSIAASRWHEGYLAYEAEHEERTAVEGRLADTQTAYERLRKDRGYTDGYHAPGWPS